MSNKMNLVLDGISLGLRMDIDRIHNIKLLESHDKLLMKYGVSGFQRDKMNLKEDFEKAIKKIDLEIKEDGKKRRSL